MKFVRMRKSICATIRLCHRQSVPTMTAMPPAESPTNAIPAGNESALAPALLRARQLGFAVDGRTLWHNLELTLRAGERLAVAGASGSGKA
jgi:ABC-type transport system involved in cytochrome bd biosynthesis fused ATPase/permease subunit